MAFKIIGGGSAVKRLNDNAFIPDDPGNRDWQEYQKWLSKGNTPEPEFTEAALAAQAAAKAAEEARIQARQRDLDDAFPDWKTVSEKFDQADTALANATTIAAVKAVLQGLIDVNRKLARVVYWLAKDRAD